jgi:exoribonuclease R
VVTRRLRAPRIDFSALRRELELPAEFPPAAQRAAEEAARGAAHAVHEDRTEIPFVTLDPASSRDLDQAVHLARRGEGYRVSYAIADVAAFVTPGGPLDAEANNRGQTVYLPDGKVPLHPPVLSEGAASLLPDQVTPAVLWTIDLDSAGEPSTVDVRRALVRSRAKLSYTDTQAAMDAGTLAEPLRLLPEIGKLLVDAGLARGAIDLPMPDQEIEPDGDGFRLDLRAPAQVEEYNAQISLLTGRVAAGIMLAGRIGVLRTMPPAPPQAVATLRKAARALRLDWPADEPVGALLARLRPSEPRAAAFVEQAADLLRGAGYTAFDGAVPDQPAHAAVAAAYAHVTAPLRRLVDRYATEVCLALHGGREVPAEVRSALAGLPETMSRTDKLANAAERGAVDLVEAVLLRGRIGQRFEAAVVDVDPKRERCTVALDEPAVRARCDGPLTLGERAIVRLIEATPETRTVRFEPA